MDYNTRKMVSGKVMSVTNGKMAQSQETPWRGFLVIQVQWLRLYASSKGPWVQSLVGELGSHMP